MKMTILYVSQSGNTAKAAEFIRDGVCSAGPVDVKMMNLIGEEPLDAEFLGESAAAIIGTPTYVANMAWQLKKWFDTERKISLAGKLGAVFSTARFIHGGPDIAMLGLLQHMITRGMLIYSSGTGCGAPIIHLGPVSIEGQMEQSRELCEIFGKRITEKALELFGE